MKSKYFQDKLATGSIPLLVAILIASLYWLLTPASESPSGNGLWNLIQQTCPGIYLQNFIGYGLLILSTALYAGLTVHHAVIRVYSTAYLSLFLLISACMLPHTLLVSTVLSCCMLGLFFFLFHTYQRIEPVEIIFQGFLFYGISTLLYPPLLWFLPFLLCLQGWFYHITLRTFFATLIGTGLPYWFLLAYAYCTGKMYLFYEPFLTAINFQPINYQSIGWLKGINLLILIGLSIWSCLNYAQSSYLDKIRTRTFIYFTATTEALHLLFLSLQPQHYNAFLCPIILCTSLLTGQYLAVNRNKRSFISFIVILVLLIILYILNLWTLLYSFF